jgi:hypothetical protein
MSELPERGITTGATEAGPHDLQTSAFASPAGPTSPSQSGGQPSAKDKAADSAQAGKQAAGEVAQTAVDNAKNVAAETKTQARNIAAEAKNQLQEQTSAQHKNLVSNLRSLADELGSMATNGDQSGVATDLVGKASDRARTAASWLDNRDPGQLVEELRRFARRRPGAFLAGALAAGVVAGRLTRGVAAVHSSDNDASAHVSGTNRNLGTLPAGGVGYDRQQLPTGGAAYPSDTVAAYPSDTSAGAYPPPLATERIDEPGGGRW